MAYYHPAGFLERMKFVSSLREQRPKALFGVKDPRAPGYPFPERNEVKERLLCPTSPPSGRFSSRSSCLVGL